MKTIEQQVEKFHEADKKAGLTKKIIVSDMHDRENKSFTEIGRLLGLSRQRVHQIYHLNT